MKVLQAALSILIDITENKQTFHNALRSYFDKNKDDEVNSGNVSAFVGCELRHHIVFMQLGEDLNKNLTNKSKLAVGLALSNTLFLKRLDDEVVLNFVEEVFKQDGRECDKKALLEFLDAKRNGEPLISPTLDKMSFKFISQRYNVNEWIAKMWTHNFNKNTAFKIARANTKSPVQHLRVNTLLTDKEKLLTANPDTLTTCDFNDDLLVYAGKQPVRKQKFVISNRCYQINAGLKELIDKLPINPVKPVYIFSGYYNLIPLELGVKYKNELKIENFTTPDKDYFLFKNNLARYQIKNVKTTECRYNQFITVMSEKAGLFILMPENSNFERLRIDPDYFLNFDRMKLDELINMQQVAIEDASKYIEDNGYLVYAVPTIDKKEAQNIVATFLTDHEDFELIDEVQHFPFDPTNSTLYYAILKKQVKND